MLPNLPLSKPTLPAPPPLLVTPPYPLRKKTPPRNASICRNESSSTACRICKALAAADGITCIQQVSLLLYRTGSTISPSTETAGRIYNEDTTQSSTSIVVVLSLVVQKYLACSVFSSYLVIQVIILVHTAGLCTTCTPLQIK